jgi:hypothetical protein
MHKPHLVMIVTGLGGMLALTLMMQHLLTRHAETRVGGQVGEAFTAKFVQQLEQPPMLFVRESDDEAVGFTVIAKVRPKQNADVDLLLSDMGAFLWSLQYEQGTPTEITIRYRDSLTRESYNHNVPPPQKARPVAPKPTPKPASPTTPAAKSPSAPPGAGR